MARQEGVDTCVRKGKKVYEGVWKNENKQENGREKEVRQKGWERQEGERGNQEKWSKRGRLEGKDGKEENVCVCV